MDPNPFKNVSLCFIIAIWIIHPFLVLNKPFSFITYGYKSQNNIIWFFIIFICNLNFLGLSNPVVGLMDPYTQ